MRHRAGLIIGIGFILVAFWMALGASNQDTAPRPPSALALATQFHLTPSPTSPPTATPRPIPSPLPSPPPTPTTDQIMDLIFNTPPQTMYRVIPPENLTIRAVHSYYLGQDELIVTGDRTRFYMEGQFLPAAFGAVLMWDHGQYAVKFSHLLLGRQGATVTLSMTPENGVTIFFFDDIGPGGNGASTIEHAYHVDCFIGTCQVLGSR